MSAAGNLTLMFSFAKGLAAKIIVKMGVAYGLSSPAFLLSLRKRLSGLLSVDLPYIKLRSDKWVGRVVPPDLRSRWKLYHCADWEGVSRAIRVAGPMDLARYDSDKTVPGRLWGYKMLWESLQPGGVLILDDTGDNPGFREFWEKVGLFPVIVSDIVRYRSILGKPL